MDDKNTSQDELRPEYDEAFLKGGIRGKYAERYAASARMARLAPDVATVFPDDEALRAFLRAGNDPRHPTPRRAETPDHSESENVEW